MMMDKENSGKGVLEHPTVAKLAAVLLLIAIVFLGAKAVNAIVNFDTITQPASNVITVMGEGKVMASPDIATVSFTVTSEANTASQAQDDAAKKVNTALAVLDDLGIDKKDVKTSSYYVQPKYSYQPPCYTYPCPYQESKIVGFTASQTVDVKVRDLDKTGEVLSQLGDAGISNLYGPNFTVENEDELKNEARASAIKKAREQAKDLASSLGVRIVRLVSYSDSGNYPIPYLRADAAYGMGGGEKATAPSLPAGENEIVVNVSVTYEIR